MPMICDSYVGLEDAEIVDKENARILFEPPLWSQRLRFVCQEVNKHGAKKVVDYGCGAGRLLLYLKHVEVVSEMWGLDVNGSVLDTARRELEPLYYDHVCPRHESRTITLLKGSVDVVDGRLAGADLLACVEVIEHLHPPALHAFPSVVFGALKPAVAVITTPNRDYNVLFGWGEEERLRDADHKFEWSRTEFQKWCQNTAHEYGYDVTFTGVGDPPPTHQHLGWATQIAVFVRKHTTKIPLPPQPDMHTCTHTVGKFCNFATKNCGFCDATGVCTEEYTNSSPIVLPESHELVAHIMYPVDEYTPAERAEIDAVACCRNLAIMGRSMEGGITREELWSLLQSRAHARGSMLNSDWLLEVLRSSPYFAQMDGPEERWALVDDESDEESVDWSDASV
eukprot:comp6212_c0_seq1/m.2043 comp6212_c0_seq1/g.2043  ORF comp6212_c0_seq1/g.2043 comp6212_c0_seq1/m.2043 type:complete len:396 (-) comp6212_c0_seq1:9-1196(-)